MASQRAMTQALMRTEYMDKFIPPHCNKTLVTSTSYKHPYHPLRATCTDVSTLRTFYLAKKRVKNAPKPPQPSMLPKAQQRTKAAPHNPSRWGRSETRVEDYKSVYQNDFRVWEMNKRQPFRLSDSLKVNQGLSVTRRASKGGLFEKSTVCVPVDSKPDPKIKETQPIESSTSYRSDYVVHPVQPKTRREKPVKQSNKGLLSEPKAVWDVNQELFDNSGELNEQFKSWSIETKFQGKAKESTLAQDHEKFLSTTHADFPGHQWFQRTKPILPSVQNYENSKDPFHATTTMKEDFKAWSVPRRFPIVHKQKLNEHLLS
ncbi:stabilizer of axonemal microtubules 1-like [Notolabrus celidotus]|uniref:stabilizer of axonemal microtubules 1-like n=1 Tax=Notolabrus celidotus TaxID=1203425 RepID=UPI00148FDCF8|nr:stabilizer of axonemal microtubules 1-like [Notolabrus celidotus]